MVPGALRQTDAPICQTKTTVQQLVVSRAGTLSDQYLVYIDTNRDIFCVSLSSDASYEIFKIGKIASHVRYFSIFERKSFFSHFKGTQVISALWASDSGILVGLHDSCYSVWYCPGEACADPTVIALTTITFDVA